MTKAHTFKVKKNKNATEFEVTVPNWPTTTTEAISMWGEAHVMNCINGSSATVQAQGYCRTQMNRTENPLTQAKVVAHMAEGKWKPSDGSTKRISQDERTNREYEKSSPAEKIAFLMLTGLDEETATALVNRKTA